MFVRKRIISLKKGEISERYQVVEAYRKGNKVRQNVISLGEYESVKEALKNWEIFLRRMEKDLSVPVDEYMEIRYSRLFNTLVKSRVPLKTALKRRMKLLKKYEGLKSNYLRLKKMSCNKK